VRPLFAAIVFGGVAFLFLLGSGIYFFLTNPSKILIALSIASPSLPLSYLAFRGFKPHRKSAFDDLPEAKCLMAAGIFCLVAILFAYLGGDWRLSMSPLLGALIFALCERNVREFFQLFFFAI